MLTIEDYQTWMFENATLKFASGTGLDVNGTLNVDNATFTSSGSSWEGIYFASGSSGTLDGVTVENVSSGAVVTINGASPRVKRSTIQSTSGGGAAVYLDNGADPYLYDNTISNSNGHGIHVYDSNGHFVRNVVEASGHNAFFAEQYAEPDFTKPSSAPQPSHSEGRNTLKNSSYGLTAQFNSEVDAGIPGNGTWAAANRFIGNSMDASGGYDGNTVYAGNNWWGESPPDESELAQGYHSTLHYDDWLTSDPQSGWNSQETTGEPVVAVMASREERETRQATTAPGDASLSMLLAEARRLRGKGRYDEALSLSRQVLEQAAPSSRAAERALVGAGVIYRQSGSRSALEVVKARADASGPLQPVALSLLASGHRAQGKYQAGLSAAQELAEEASRARYAGRGEISSFFFHLAKGDVSKARGALATFEAEQFSSEKVQGWAQRRASYARYLLQRRGMEEAPPAPKKGGRRRRCGRGRGSCS